MALDVEPENGAGRSLRILSRLRDLDAAGLAATAGLDLRLDDGHAADALGGRTGLLRSVGDDARQHGNTVLLEEIPGLVLVKIHAARPIRVQKERVKGVRSVSRVSIPAGEISRYRDKSQA